MQAAVVENEVAIRRSPEEVFDYCTDLTREHEWNPKTRRVEKLTGGPIGPGTRFEAEFLKGDPMTIEVVRFERPRAWETVVNPAASKPQRMASSGRVTMARASSCAWSCARAACRSCCCRSLPVTCIASRAAIWLRSRRSSKAEVRPGVLVRVADVGFGTRLRHHSLSIVP